MSPDPLHVGGVWDETNTSVACVQFVYTCACLYTVGPVYFCLSLFSYNVNLIIASVQIAHRGGLLIE